MPRIKISKKSNLEADSETSEALRRCYVKYSKCPMEAPGYELAVPKVIAGFSASEPDSDEDDNGDNDDDDESTKEGDTEEQTEFEVERLVRKMIYNGVVAYETKWKGYSSAVNTRETIQHLINSLNLIKEFEISRPPKQKIEVFIDKADLKSKEKEPKPIQRIKDIVGYCPSANKFFISWTNTFRITIVDGNTLMEKCPLRVVKFFREAQKSNFAYPFESEPNTSHDSSL